MAAVRRAFEENILVILISFSNISGMFNDIYFQCIQHDKLPCEINHQGVNNSDFSLLNKGLNTKL